MDGASLAIIIPSVMGAVGGLISIYGMVVKNKGRIEVDDATLIRSNLIPTSVWLEQQAKRDEQIRLLNERLDAQRADYEKRLELKDKHIEKISAEFRTEIHERDIQIESLKDEVKELRHELKGFQQIQLSKDEIRTFDKLKP